ncbi:MAG: hypothetical protein RLN85_16015, partial [Pseudomonadales bacterium]
MTNLFLCLQALSSGAAKRWGGTGLRAVYGVLLTCLFLILFSSGSAQASFTDCPANNNELDPLTLNLTVDECTLETGAAGSAGGDDLIQIQIVSGADANFFILDPGVGGSGGNDPRDLVFSVNNGSPQGTLDADNGSLVNINCSAGCVVSGTHGGTPFSFTYTQSAGGGSLGSAEINVQGNGTSIVSGDTT